MRMGLKAIHIDGVEIVRDPGYDINLGLPQASAIRAWGAALRPQMTGARAWGETWPVFPAEAQQGLLRFPMSCNGWTGKEPKRR